MPPCEVCGKEGNLRCDKCGSAWYCCLTHQRGGWVSHYARCQRARGRAPGTTISTSTTNQGDDANMVSGGSVSSTIPCIPEPNMLPNDGITLDGEDMRALDNGTRHPGAPSKDFSDTTGHRTSRAWSQQLSQRSPRTVSKQGGSIGSSRLKSQALVGPAIPVDPSVMYPELCPGMCLYINLDRRTDRKKTHGRTCCSKSMVE